MDNEAQVANRATPVVIVSWDATDLTAANTASYKLRRSHDLGSTWTDIEVSDWLAGKCYDMTVLPSRSYMYQIVDNPDSSEGDFGTASSPLVAMRYIGPQNADAIFSDGEGGQSWAPWGKAATLAFDGGLGQANYLDPGRRPEYSSRDVKMGIDFGAADRHVAFCRAVPRCDSGANMEHRINDMAVYGAIEDWTTEKVALSQTFSEVNGNIADGSGFAWYSVDVDSTTPYRYIYVFGATQGNVTEVEFWGWTAADLAEAAKIDDVTFSIERSDYENSYAVFTFNGNANGLAVQRRFGTDGEWTEVGVVSNNAFTDETAPYGGKVYYRLSNGTSVTSEQSFLRMHRISIDSVTFFTDAPMTATTWVKPVSNSFDGDTSTYADLDKDTAKLGVDFGSRSVAVALVRAMPRGGTLTYRMKNAILYGSVKGAAEEGATSDKAIALTDPFPSTAEGEWCELQVQTPSYYRSYYVSKNGEFHGNISEVEFYGWTLSDIDNPPLEFTVVWNNLDDFKPLLSWNAIGRAVEVQRADNAEGPWGTLATTAANESSYVDSSVKRYGLKYFYRLKYGNTTSEVQSFVRLRRLVGTAFTNSEGPNDDKPEHALDKAFDGLTEGYVELKKFNDADPKVGMEFADGETAVALVRFYPRHEWEGNLDKSNVRVFASNRTAAEESADTVNGEAITEATTFVNYTPPAWQERWVESPGYYRCYYYQGNYLASMSEIEFYGYLMSDVVRPFRVYIR